jgi:formate-dependent nitrite reductase membrane component NrfD
MRAQHKWLFDHAVYLFLGGLGAAAYVVGAIAGFLGPQWTTVSKIGVIVSFPAVAVGSVFLMAGLGNPMKSFHAWKKPGTSWISRGVIFITLFSIVAIIHAGLCIWPDALGAGSGAGLRNFLSVFGIIFAFFVMIYTGFLLAASRPIAFWSSGILPLLFLFSALASGVLIVLFIAVLHGLAAPVLKSLTYVAIALLITDMLTLMFHMHAAHRVPEGQKAEEILTRGSGALLFWLGVVVVGFIIPLALFALTVASAGHVGLALGALFGLAGNLCLREAILQGGVMARLKAGCFEYVVTNP